MKNVIIAFTLTLITTFGFSQRVITLEKKDGTYFVPCTVNDLVLKVIIDTNASDVSISLNEVDYMIKNGYIKKDADLIVTKKYNVLVNDIAEGSKVIIRKLEIGGKAIYNIESEIDNKLSAPLIIGQSVIKKFGTFAIDFSKRTLTIKESATATEVKNIGSIKDPRDGKTYKTVVIGTQTWMAENLNCYTSVGSWCYDNNTSNCELYGRLYNEETARKSCPKGWHLPGDAEWDILNNYLEGDVGNKLKSTTGWNSNGSGTDAYGFTALPGGYRSFNDLHFNYIGEYGFWWSSTESSAIGAWSRYISNDHREIYRIGSDNKNGFSVRCLKNK